MGSLIQANVVISENKLTYILCPLCMSSVNKISSNYHTDTQIRSVGITDGHYENYLSSYSQTDYELTVSW